MALVNEGNLAGAATEFETYLKLVAGRAERRHREIARRAAEEVAAIVLDPAALRARLDGVRERIARRRRPGRARPRRHPPRRHLQDIPRRTRPRRRERRAASTSARTRSRKRCRRWTARPTSPLTWHFVGHLQSNKARKAAQRFDVVHSVDTADLALRLDEAAARSRPDAEAAGPGRSGRRSRRSWGAAPTQLPAILRPRPAASPPASSG